MAALYNKYQLFNKLLKAAFRLDSTELVLVHKKAPLENKDGLYILTNPKIQILKTRLLREWRRPVIVRRRL